MAVIVRVSSLLNVASQRVITEAFVCSYMYIVAVQLLGCLAYNTWACGESWLANSKGRCRVCMGAGLCHLYIALKFVD